MPSRRPLVLAVVASALALVACRREPTDAQPAPRRPERSPPQPFASATERANDGGAQPGEAHAPLAGFPAEVDLLPPAGAKDPTRYGIVTVPLGAREPRPLVVALHGGSDRPEWACSAWRGVSEGHAFVVCPRGPGSESALGWSSPADTRMRVDRAVAAARAMFGDFIADGPTVLVGFSMGATQAALLAASDPTRYPRVVLTESSYAPDAAISFSRPWGKGGGERALFACTTQGCPAVYRSAAKIAARNHVSARLNDAKTTSHGMWVEVVASLRRDWPWLVAGVPGWERYVAPSPEGLQGSTESFAAE